MTLSAFTNIILRNLGFPPTASQTAAIDMYVRFLASRIDQPVMILRGSAGTGKTSLVAAMVKAMLLCGQKVVLMAPTGRAAKVLSVNCDYTATTIHRKIYRQKSFGKAFQLNQNLNKNTLFVVDEASMISTYGSEELRFMSGESRSSMFDPDFGSGNLLDDLVQYVYASQNNNRLMLIGDTAQLPPVGEDEAPALMPHVLEGYGLQVFGSEMNEVLRQSQESGILWNATNIRRLITHDETTSLPKIRFSGFADILPMPGNELIESLAESYHSAGLDDTIVVTRSNKTATIYNNGIRNAVLDRDDILSTGDQIMIVKNNYYWLTPDDQDDNAERKGKTTFLANGDRATVLRVSHHRELYGFHFADVTLRFPDYEDLELDTIIITDTLTTESPALTREQSEKLFRAVEEDYMDITIKRERIKAIMRDKYYNALQVKFAYAVTCHKAQGGQWSHVYVNQGYMTDDMLTPDYIHWLYTSFTRATQKLFLVNWPKEQRE